MFETNEVLNKLPDHLRNLIIDQPYNDYTAQDHAVWRYVMRQNVHFLKDVAHETYLDGLKKTGININQIPHMYGMNRILKEIGWAAVAVDGFIPPSAFMEFQAYNVLVIAADIRPIKQIGYTPAPDIIHEAAGHAPIIANPEYANYLKLFGEYGSKAFSSAKDKELYLAIRHLSILKANPYTSKKDIRIAEQELFELENNLGEPSEVALIRNLHWWTVEYGLIGDLKNPKIYGAGLLSSITESKNALSPKVKKLPYSIHAMTTGFDITSMQPQLFVTPDFEYLTTVLEQFVDGMALRTGGISGLRKAIDSGDTATIEYSSGLQVSGTFVKIESKDGEVYYIQTKGGTALSYKNQELEGHSKSYHKDGFSSPAGKISNIPERFELLTDEELESKGIYLDKVCELEFESGVKVKGLLKNILRKDHKILLMSFEECVVTYQNHVLFFPEWGTYDMAVGEKITSVFNGPADPKNFGYLFEVPEEKTHKIMHSEEAKKLHLLYQKVRNIREQAQQIESLKTVLEKILKNHPDEWLILLEIFEINKSEKVLNELQRIYKTKPDLKKLIENGLAVINYPVQEK